MKYCEECNEYYTGRTLKGMCDKCYQRQRNQGKKYELPKYGEVKYAPDGKVICHICGRAYKKVLTHAVQIHGITEKEYKREFGLDVGNSLMCESSKEIARQRLLENYDKVVLENLVNNENSHKTRFTKGHKGRTIEKVSHQTLKRLKQTSFVKKKL